VCVAIDGVCCDGWCVLRWMVCVAIDGVCCDRWCVLR
jgi:hypothetical protein